MVYDSLVGDSVLSMIPRTARLINVGKRAGNHLMKQEGINQVLLEEAENGYRVVNGKGEWKTIRLSFLIIILHNQLRGIL